jgi:hypothetical protein
MTIFHFPLVSVVLCNEVLILKLISEFQPPPLFKSLKRQAQDYYDEKKEEKSGKLLLLKNVMKKTMKN